MLSKCVIVYSSVKVCISFMGFHMIGSCVGSKFSSSDSLLTFAVLLQILYGTCLFMTISTFVTFLGTIRGKDS